MEHIVQFGISIDDDRITKAIEEKAEKEIIHHLHQRIDNILFEARYYGGRCDPNEGLRTWAKERFDMWLNENKDALIDCAGKYLAEKLSRTKAARELLKGE
jgi:hypothetical protein